MSSKRSTVLGLVAVVVIISLPGLVLVAAGQEDVAGLTALAALTGVMTSLMAGARVAVITSIALGAASAAAVVVAGSPWLAALLMAAVAAAAGMSSLLGAQNAVMMAPISLAFLLGEPPVTATGGAVPAGLVGAVMLGSALWATLAGSILMRGRKRPERHPLSHVRSTTYAVVLGIAVGSSSWFLVDRQLGHGGAWFVMTLLIVLQPYLQDSWHKTVQRAAGTVVGFAIALVVYELLDLPVVLYVAAAAFMLLALVARMVKHRPYWQFVALLTPAIVLLEGGPGNVVDTAMARLGFTLLGVGVAVVLELAMAPIVKGFARRHPTGHY